MKRFPKKQDVIDSVIGGLLSAKKNYSYWTSDELYLSNASGKFLSIHIAQEIAKLQDCPEIFLDANVSDILRCSLPSRSEFRAFMKKNHISERTVDITLDERFTHKSDNDSISKVIISVQNGVRNAKKEYLNDIELMCQMLQRDNKNDSTLDYAIFAFYLDISSSARKGVQDRIDIIVESFDEIISEHKNLKSSFQGGNVHTIENIGQWCVGCYIIEHTL